MTVLHTIEEVAEKLRVSRRWVQDFIKEHPYYRLVGNKKLFTDADVNRLIEALPCPSSSSRRAKARRPIGTAKARTSESLWSKANRVESVDFVRAMFMGGIHV